MSFLEDKIDIDDLLSDEMEVENEDVEKGKVEKGGVDDTLVEKIKKMKIDVKNVRFTHSIYGVIRRGEYKGREVEIREYYPGKFEVLLDKRGYISIGKELKSGDKIMGCEVISDVGKEKDKNIYKYLISCKKNVLFAKKSVSLSGNNVKVLKGEMKGLTGKLIKDHKSKLLVSFDASGSRIMKFMDVDDIFYKDLLLKSSNYFQVDKIEVDSNKKYKIFFKERQSGLGDIKKVIEMSDIKSLMPGTDLGDKKQINVIAVSKDDVEYVSEEIDESEEMESGDEDEGESDDGEYGEEDFAPSYRDIERTEVITQQLSPIQRAYYDMKKNILNIVVESIENIKNDNKIDDIERITE